LTSPDSGSGSQPVSFEVGENFTGSPRTGSLTIAGVTFSVLQDAGLPDCSYIVAPQSAPFSSSGGTGSLNVFAEQRCAWFGSSNVGWISITGGEMGIGNGTVNYVVSANQTGVSRKGRITIGGQIFTVKQK
jgi:hypothetical protein